MVTLALGGRRHQASPFSNMVTSGSVTLTRLR
jgi:hypothetical protein